VRGGTLTSGESLGESRTDVALNVFEISGLAWALTVHKAAEALAHEPDVDLSGYKDSVQALAVRELDAEAAQAAEAELRRAGIVDGTGAITRQWMLAVWIAASGPLKVTSIVQSAGLSVHTELGLAGGRGVGVTYSRRISHGAEGVVVTEVRNAVEICFFAEENAWAAIKRHLPDLTQVPEPTEQQKPPMATSSEAAEDAKYTIHLHVSAHPAGSDVAALGTAPGAAAEGVPGSPRGRAPDHVSWDIWALAQQLYSVRTGTPGDEPALTPVAPNDLSREFAWRLLGAREYLASTAEKAA
jgi:hypothetical protein